MSAFVSQMMNKGGLLLGGGLLNSITNQDISAVIHNLQICDVKVEGLCCYFPGFCDPIAHCLSEAAPTNVFEIAQSIPKCVCPDGYSGDGKAKPRGTGCNNIDECALGIAKCGHKCIDLDPGYRCECREGYRLGSDDHTCIDINECIENSHRCEHRCENTDGSYQCSCEEGYQLYNRYNCQDIDECATALATGFSVCQYDDLCINIPGSYVCGCPPGLQPKLNDERQCEDIDECLTSSLPCPNSLYNNTPTQACQNVYATHVCECLPGTYPLSLSDNYTTKSFALRGMANESPKEQFLLTTEDISERRRQAASERENLICEDIDECVAEDPCQPKTEKQFDLQIAPVCVNTLRGYVCECMDSGVRLNPESGWCEDIDECSEHSLLEICGTEDNVECENEKPGYRCRCHSGYEWNNELARCLDIDECSLSADTCPANQKCLNTIGSYECRCPEGYEENGDECNDIDECALGLCAGPCVNYKGGYVCGCPKGTAPWGFTNGKQQDNRWEKAISEYRGEGEGMYSTTEFEKKLNENNIWCDDMDECKLTNSEVCGVGYRCINGKSNSEGFQCTCSTNQQTIDNPGQSFRVSVASKIGTELQKVNHSDIVVTIANEIGPWNLFKALTVLSPGSPLWKFTRINWDDVSQVFLAKPSVITHVDSYMFLMQLMEDFVSQFQLRTCIPLSACKKKSPNPCPRVSTPCCRDLPTGESYECIMPILTGGGPAGFINNILRRTTSSRRYTCPAGSVDRSLG